MDTIQMTKTMVKGLGKQKKAGYSCNLHPTIPVAILEVHGESMKLKMDCFSESGNTGRISFEILREFDCIALGKAEFLLDETEIRKVQFESITDISETGTVDGFVRKCILLLNEFNYIEWQNEVCGTKGIGDKSDGGKVKTKRTYYIDPALKAGDSQPLETEEDMMEMLRSEEKSFSAERKHPPKKTPKVTPPENGVGTVELTVKDVRTYLRRTRAWYVRGHYDHHGKYHKFHFATSAIPIGKNYADYRKPIVSGVH